MIEVDTTLAEEAGITARTSTVHSYFAKVKDAPGKAPFRLWTDRPYAATLADFKTRARDMLRKRDIVIEVGPGWRRGW